MTRKLSTSLVYFFLLAFSLVYSFEEENEEVTCGSAIKIMNTDGAVHYLHSSEGTAMRGGSGQQLVTWVPEKNAGSADNLWLVRPRNKMIDSNSDTKATEYNPYPAHLSQRAKKKGANSCTFPGEKIRCNTIVRLTHVQSKRNLHSHTFTSPLSHQQEVSAYGKSSGTQGDVVGDAGDNWFIRCNTDYWQRNSKVKLQHVETQTYLGSNAGSVFKQSNCGRNCPIMDHLESFARTREDSMSDITVKSGIHLYM